MAMITEVTISTIVTTMDCQRKMVSLKGMTPVIGRSDFGRLFALAWSCAAEEDRPIAQTAPRPR